MGGASLAVKAEMAPDADYDLKVVALEGTDRAVVRATRFHTSRYARPRALVDALGYTSRRCRPFLPDDFLLADGVTLPAGAFVEGDAALDTALAAIDAETLPLPDAQRPLYGGVELRRDARLAGRGADRRQRRADAAGDDGHRCRGPAGAGHAHRAAASSGRRHGAAIVPRERALDARHLQTGGAVRAERRDRARADADLHHIGRRDVLGTRRLRAVPSIIEREGL